MDSLKNTAAALAEMMDAVFDAVFPVFAAPSPAAPSERIARALSPLAGGEVAQAFILSLPEIKRLLETDVKAIEANDPAATGAREIIFCYPAVKAILYYRAAHRLWEMHVPILPRMLTEYAHSVTGIDIHPGAVIGEHFAIDHGTGTVIGETAVIGNHVTLYQGVTLGARNFVYDETGRPRNVPRHPILEDDVTVYSNASLLGRITVGTGSIIGGNVWLTHSVPPHSRIVQSPSRESFFRDGDGI
jgi:serine O-acetyltransferase